MINSIKAKIQLDDIAFNETTIQNVRLVSPKNFLHFLESQKLHIFQENRVYCKLIILLTVIFFCLFFSQ